MSSNVKVNIAAYCKNFTASRVQQTSNYPWPYIEALTIEEAQNELTILTVGAFGKLLTPQQGSPIRLNVPWKYGFKSIKSIQKITLLEDDGNSEKSRKTFWSTTNGLEYGFYANINPEIPHRRWSQATERHYVTGFPGTRIDTIRMNGYQEQVRIRCCFAAAICCCFSFGDRRRR